MKKTEKPRIGIFKEHRSNDWSRILLDNTVFDVESKYIKHHVEKEDAY